MFNRNAILRLTVSTIGNRKLYSSVDSIYCRSFYCRQSIRIAKSSNTIIRSSWLSSMMLSTKASTESTPLTAVSGAFAKSARKMVKQRRAATINDNVDGQFMIGIAVADAFNLNAIAHDSTIVNSYRIRYLSADSAEIWSTEHNCTSLHLSALQNVDHDDIRDCFLFSDGVAVFWNYTEIERLQILNKIQLHQSSAYDLRLVDEETDQISFSLTENTFSQVKHDHILLNVIQFESKHMSNEAILERFAFSHAMAISVKVGIWESQLSILAESATDTTKAMKLGKIKWDRKETLIKAGEFASLKQTINLDCDLLATDIYWDRRDLENIYNKTRNYFNVLRRCRELNTNIDCCQEVTTLVDNYLSHNKSVRLEWIIIILIVIEVIFDVMHFIEDRNWPWLEYYQQHWFKQRPVRVVVVTDDDNDQLE